MSKIKLKRNQKRLVAAFVSGFLGIGLGVLLMQLNLGERLRYSSYDLPFLLGPKAPPDDIVLVYLDDASFVDLEQSITSPLDRRIHAAVVDFLDRSGARLIVFDILFHDSLPEQDSVFADVIESHGNVVLVGEYTVSQSSGADREVLFLANPTLRRPSAGWGLSTAPIDNDGVIRQIPSRVETHFGSRPTLSAFAFQLDSGREVSNTGYINYYGPSGTFPSYSYSELLLGAELPEAAFRDKIVVIGARQNAGSFSAGKDTFPTPYSRLPVQNSETGEWRIELTPGMEIQATAIANLLEDEAISLVSRKQNLFLVIVAGLLFGGFSCLSKPLRGILTSVTLGLCIAALGVYLQRQHGILLYWMIPVMAQLPFAVAVALLAHYLIEYSARWKLRSAFKSYMSDEQARQIDDEEVSLELGGKEIDATILFSDLAGFTSMSEGLPPDSVSKALIAYFESATQGILDNHGTIIKYVGDAVMATWGAPLPVNREADRAIDAAIKMQLDSREPITLQTESGTRSQVLETRIGINSGLALAGNLGSRRRFDYSVIGDTTNTAARLEGLNKMLGTSILVSDSVLKKCEQPERYRTRLMGNFVLKGKKVGILVHEVLGYQDAQSDSVRDRSALYLETYRLGLDAFIRGDWALAREKLEVTLTAHDRLSEDPATRLILESMKRHGDQPPEDEWVGHIVLDSK